MKLYLAALLLLGLQGNPPVETVVQRASRYVDTYMKDLGSIVGEEVYVQEATWGDLDLRRRPLRSQRARTMVSDFLALPVGDQYVGVRHVRKVDDVPLDPLYRSYWRESFDESTAEGRDGLQKALTFESTRYNIGDFNRSTNLPTFPLEILDPANLSLFTFKKDGEEKIFNVLTWKVKFNDRNRNTIIMASGIGPNDRYSISGTLWIEPATGRVFRASIELENPIRNFVEIRMDVRFRIDAGVGALVPAAMEEHYKDRSANHELDAHADYLNYRRFGSDVKLDTIWNDISPAVEDLKKERDNGYAMKVDVRVVNVEAWVTAGSGSPVTDLKADDFQVFENGSAQKITNFSPVNTPYDVLMLFDRSGSTQRDWASMQKAAEGFLANLRPQDRAGIANFDTSFRMLTRWTQSREQVAHVVAGLAEGKRPGGTAFYRAVEMSLASELIPVSGRRRAVIVLTDGRDSGLTNTLFRRGTLLGPREEPAFVQMLELAKRERVPIYVVTITNNANEVARIAQFYSPEVANNYLSAVATRLEQLVEVSGGRALFPRRLADIVPLYSQISRELGSAYSIGYVSDQPPAFQGFREIKVATREPNLHVVQSRAGYVWQP